ncbi:MAG: response regulator [Leptospirales bacterium]|nr:response regulator [Leptospirales bacterium]
MKDFQTILIVDAERMTRFTLQEKLSRSGYNIVSLEKAEDAIYLIKSVDAKIALVISDIKLYKMDGIELLRRIKAMAEPIPVLLLAGKGNMEDVIAALRLGADDFIRKPFDVNDVVLSAHSILRRKQEEMMVGAFARFLEYEKSIYVIPNEISLVNMVSYQLTKNLIPMGFCNRTTAENISLALKEAITNAMFHGNLEISSAVREQDGIKGFNEKIEKRKDEPLYKNRKVRIVCEETFDYIEYSIEDDGPGFDYRSIPDPRDPENFFKNSGRGLLIISVHFDEVRWNDKGNSIYLKKRRITARENT